MAVNKEKLKPDISEDRCLLILENASDLIGIINRNFKFEYINQQACIDILGYTKEEVIGKSPIDFVSEDDKQGAFKAMISAYKKGGGLGEIRAKHKNGDYIWLEVKGRSFYDNLGNLKGVILARDITEKKNLEKKLKESEENYRLVTENSNDVVSILNRKFKVEFINERALEKVLGYSKEDMIKKKGIWFAHPDDRERIFNEFVKVFDGRELITEGRLKHKNGNYIYTEFSGNLFYDERGNPKFHLSVRDISERKKAEDELKQSEEKFRAITEQSFMSILVIQDGFIKYFNDRVSQLNGYSREEIEKWGPYEFMKVVHPNDKSFVLDQAKKKQAGEKDVIPQYRYRLIRKDKEIRWIENFSKTINFEGRPADLITSIDVTDKIEAERKLKESEERYRLIAENSDTVIWSTDMNLNMTYVSANSPKILGYTAEEAIKLPINKSLTQESLKTVTQIFKEELRIERKKEKNLNRSRTFETEQIHKNGSIIPVEMTITFLRDDNCKAIAILGISKNISERRKAEEAIKIEKKFTEDVINASNDTIFVFNPQTGKAIQWNKAFNQVSGYSDEEVASLKAPESYYSEEDLMKAEKAIQKVLQGGKATLEMKLITKDGSKIPYEYTGTALKDTDGNLLIVSIGRDITERKEIELKLKESEEKFRALVETTSDWIWEVDTNGIYTYSNPRIKDILGYEVEEVIGKHPFDLMPKGESERIEIIFQNTKQEKNSLLSLENVNIHKDGHLITLETSGIPFFDKKGELLGYRGIDRNITEKKQAEIKLRESEQLLKERVKELNLLFEISKIAENQNLSSQEFIKEAINLIPTAMQFPELTSIRIIFDDYEFKSENFKKTKRKIGTQININKKRLNIEIYYIKDYLFLPEEKNLLDEIGKRFRIILEKKESEQNRKLAREELEKSFEKLKELEKIINNSPGVLFLWKNSQGWPVEFVSKNVDQFGYTQEDFYSGNVIYGEIIHPDDLERVSEEVNTYSNEDINEFVQEYRIITKSKEVKWLDDRTWIRRDSEGNISHYQGIVLDITDRKVAEEALKMSEKNYKDAYDKANFYRDLFTHDINNILQIINSSAELISLQLGDSEKSKNLENMTKMIKSQVERGSKLVSNVRTLTELEQEKLSKIRIDINLFLQKSIEFVKKAYSERILDISFNLTNGENFTEANVLLQDVFENVLINGIKYNENSKIEIYIKISKEKFDGKNHIKIEFVDNGIGVADNRKKIIFQRGHRELKGSKGMGLGLSLVSEILKTFNGKIWVEDRVKGDYTKGSKFIILLPELK
ncbi:MAG: PAS domain S-box protein [Candidatus Hermodarchaeota archaeon]